MAIRGLLSSDVAAPPVTPINVQDRAALAFEAVSMIGRIDDRAAFLESATQEFAELQASVDRPAETYVQLSFGAQFSALDLLNRMDVSII